MHTDESERAIALQPESQIEQQLLSELFARLNNIAESPPHPEKVGSELVYYTLDIPEYDGLDAGMDAEVNIGEGGRLDPEPGSRALVVVHNPSAAEVERQTDAPEATQEAVDAAVESLGEGDDGGENEYTVTPEEVADEIEAAMPLDECDYRQLQAFAQDASTAGYDIAANQSTEVLIEALYDFAAHVSDGFEVPSRSEAEDDGDEDSGAEG